MKTWDEEGLAKLAAVCDQMKAVTDALIELSSAPKPDRALVDAALIFEGGGDLARDGHGGLARGELGAGLYELLDGVSRLDLPEEGSEV